ncbi:LysM peptidoglycan-binding domain-containing protein [Gemmatimonas sp.]|uniref:LysM peptidoglycan-binding domain-containing protein n=1 Tax=Gemmatimonas sp. TaxID=1962908 RepID=UPI00286E6EF0|nr:LysM peptidoglycan-binding domain-containing protein [Gemmatimonas sp.]
MAIHDPSANPVENATAALDTAASAESAGAASSPRRAGWLRAGAAAPPARRQRSPWVRLLVALTSSTALLGTAGLVAAAAIVPPIGARRTAREAAQQEVLSQLGPDERVVARAFASQRRWTDMWRESFGVVVATNRRLLYVGAPPTPLLRPREDGPTELLVESYPFDAAFTLEPRTLFRGYGRGLKLRTPAAQVDFIVDDDSWTSALRVSQASAAARRSVTRDEEALSATTRAPAPPAALYVRYIVQRGETLTGLARRFRTSPDVLRQLNQLSTDEIKVGQRLRVPKVDLDTLP